MRTLVVVHGMMTDAGLTEPLRALIALTDGRDRAQWREVQQNGALSVRSGAPITIAALDPIEQRAAA